MIEKLEQRLYLTATNEDVFATSFDQWSASSALPPADLIALVADQSVAINGQDGGRIFDGLGAVSASSSRLLFDYPEPARSDILDYMFKPNYGAGIQILKVEIGGDMNSTAGAEPSHMRTPTDLNYDRGFEWWLMKEAQARNPDIILAALEWGAPGWFDGGFWSQDNIDYIISWLDGAAQHGLMIDYVGGWNESGYVPSWFVALDEALKTSYPEVKIIAADDLHGFDWRVADDLVSNEAFRNAVDVVGQHSPGEWRSLYQNYSSTPEAQSLGKPLWASEQSSLSHDVGGQAWARGINRAYIDARITASINWAPVSAWYANLPLADTGQILAEWPWSGHYMLGSTVWVYAHTTQFAQPGWQYITSGSGYLESGASYVTLKSPHLSPEGRDFSLIIETMDATAASTAQFTISGGLSTEPVSVWSSNIATDDLDDDFIHEQTIVPEGGVFTITLQPGHVYSLSTTTGQFKGDALPPSNVAQQLPLPFVEDFESYGQGELARYFSDINGGFETVPAGGGREGMAYRQMVTQQPIVWNLSGAGVMPPTTIFGDPRWWGDYEVSTEVLLEQTGSVELIGRIAAQAGQRIAGLHLQVSSSGTWRLYSQDLSNIQPNDVTIATGNVAYPVGQWHQIALRMQGNQIAVVVNGQVVGNATDSRHTIGNVGLRVSGWQNAQFDNVRVTPTAPAPFFIPQHQLSVTATSEHDIFYFGDVYKADHAIDGRPESIWHTRFNPRVPLPQSLTFDLGTSREVEALTYQPRLDNQGNGMILRYHVYLSDDGQDFTQVVTNGQWPVSTATKTAHWPAREARYVRLEAVQGLGGDLATVGEINIIATSPVVLPGDYNQDGLVNAADYTVWRDSISQSVPVFSGADGSGDGVVNGDDYVVWKTNFGNAMQSAGATAIPSNATALVHDSTTQGANSQEIPRQAASYSATRTPSFFDNHFQDAPRRAALPNQVAPAYEPAKSSLLLFDRFVANLSENSPGKVLDRLKTIDDTARYAAAIDEFFATLDGEIPLPRLQGQKLADVFLARCR